MDTLQAEKVNVLAKSLYTNRLAASMEEAFDMASGILGGSKKGEEHSVQDLTEEVPEVKSMTRESIKEDVMAGSSARQTASGLKIRESSRDVQSQPMSAQSQPMGDQEEIGLEEVSRDAASINSPQVENLDESPQNESQNLDESLNNESYKRDKMEALKRILAEEEMRIASLKEDLEKLKSEKAASGKASEEMIGEVDSLASDIDRSRKDLEEIREHVRDLEDIKHEIKDVEESQERMDELEQKAQEVKDEILEPSAPKPAPELPLDEWEDTKTEED